MKAPPIPFFNKDIYFMEKVFKNNILKFLIFGIFLTSCTSLKEDRKDISSGLVGCDPKKIEISDSLDSTWTVNCRRRTFYCSNIGDDENIVHSCKVGSSGSRRKRKKSKAKVDLGL